MKTFYSIVFALFLSLTSCYKNNEQIQNEELEALSLKADKINTLANNKTCLENSSWSFTPFGDKACGGPKRYIAYSNDIDTTQFLKLVTQYTAAEKAYNQKWSIISDCSIPQEPISVTCIDGIPTFNY